MKSLSNPQERSNWLTRHPAGTGPYRIAEPDDLSISVVTLTSFAGYWGGKPSVDRIELETLMEASDRIQALRKGKADFAPGISSGFRADLEKEEGVMLTVRPGENICYLSLNCSAKAARPTADLNLRKAIALAIRRDKFIELYEDAAVAQYTLLPECVPGHAKGYRPNGDELGDDEAIKQAKALVAKVGKPESPLRLVIPNVARPYLGQPGETAELVRKQLKAVGLEVKVEAVPMYEIIEHIEEEDYDFLLLGWMGECGEPDDFWSPLLGGKDAPGDVNSARFWDADVAKKLEQAKREPDATKRLAIYESLEKSVFDEHRPMVPVFSMTEANAWRSNWTGIEVDAAGYWHFNQAERT